MAVRVAAGVTVAAGVGDAADWVACTACATWVPIESALGVEALPHAVTSHANGNKILAPVTFNICGSPIG